jgi:hypothetical protein
LARRKITFGDWLRGAGASIRNGTAMNPFETQRQVNAAHDRRTAHYPLAKGDDYYSKHDPRFNRTGYFVDRNGNPTTTYPHVHIVADESQGLVIVTATKGKHLHLGQEKLPISASGNEVNAAIQRMARLL